MTDSIGQLRERMAALMDLRTINQLLEWDQQTMMPPRGVQTRAESLATLQRIRHEMFVSDDVGRLLDAADAEINGQGPDSDDAALIRVGEREGIRKFFTVDRKDFSVYRLHGRIKPSILP